MDDSGSTLPMDETKGRGRFSSSDNFNATTHREDEEEDEEDGGAGMQNMSNQQGMVGNRSRRYGVVDRRQQKQNRRHQAEQRSLLADKDDSDLEHNIGRLCQYLSGSEDGDDEENRPDIDDLRSAVVNGSILQRPVGLFLLNSRHNSQKRSVESATSSSIVSDENCNCEQMPSQQADNFAQVIPMQRLVPRDFLNIPPPAQPPPLDESPCNDRPLPPQRTLPPLPDEPLYEEAKPAPPPPMPRPSRQSLASQPKNGGLTCRTPISGGKASAVVSPVMASSYHEPSQRDEESSVKPLCLSQGSQYNDIDWHNYETSILERNEAGSFYIPSGQTTMSSISPSRKSEMDQKHNNYLLSPAAQTTVPVPVLPTRQEPPTSAGHRSRHHPMHSKAKMQAAFGSKRDCECCTWKCMTYSLAATMIFILAVMTYLLHLVLSSNTLNVSSPSPNSPPVSAYGSSSHYGYPTYATAVVDVGGRTNTLALRPLPESFSLGDDVVADLMPGQLAHSYFTLQRNSYVQFNVSVDPQTKLAFYGRQTLQASPTQYDFVQIVQGVKFHSRRNDVGRRSRAIGDLKRFPENLRSTTFIQYLSGGRWHLSILNDDREVRTVKFSAALTDAEREECKNNCHNKGVCKEGKCYCFDGFTGAYCEETFCPVLCSGNGIFASGKCHCHHGWKGADCDVQSNMCEVPNCNGHGQCNNKGECLCDKGYKGPFCDQRECPHENCSGHGVCNAGKCYCDFGYKGERCDILYTSDGLCPSSSSVTGHCNGRGHLDVASGRCQCEEGWLGDQCEKKLCHKNCGVHGKCVNDACSCDEGFAGEKCDQIACAPECEDNGRCSNGTCRCNDGWNGENCQLAGCPQGCNRKGDCKKVSGLWRCVCQAGFGGDDCSVPLERQCSDGVDNDGDGLVDCEDSECCSNINCQNDQYCRTVPDPYQVLIRKQSLPPHASFYQKAAFLLDPDSVQQYPDNSLFNDSRVSVVRGRVLNTRGGSLMAVRIANAANALFGFTLSRAGGYFDLVVDGGGAITLQFMRKPFLTHYMTVLVPWNQIVYIGDVVMAAKDDATASKENAHRWTQSCLDVLKNHNIKPYAAPSWKYGRRGATSSVSGIIADAAAVQESLRIPGTDTFLTYVSADAVGRESTLSLYLVPASPAKNLRLVRLMVDVEGVHFETTLETKANLTYVYGWDKRNVYKQQVSGLAAAKVSVGYIYAGCERIFWETLNVKLNGHAGSISEIGGWNLNIHHRYNILDSVLEKGDGGAVYLREELSVLVNTVGTREQRSSTCAGSSCNGPASSAQLYLPMAVATSRDGNLFIGDYNLIRRLAASNNLITVLELSISDIAHRYYLAVHPITGELYVSLPLRRQVWKIRTLTPSAAELATNYDVVVGSGEICSVESDCGDGGTAELASLTYPKGIAFDTNGNLYVADDRRIRLISISGFMSTVVGPTASSDHATTVWQPLPCSSVFDAGSFHPQWPTSLAFDYYSGSLLFLDNDVIFELDSSAKLISIRAGAPPHCSQLSNARNESTRPLLLKGATAIAAADDGRILVAETDRKRMHRIRSFDRYGRVSQLAGAESKCDCHRRHCPCDDDGGVSGVPALDAHLHNPTSIAIDQRGNVHVADEGNYKIRTLKFAVPTLDPNTKLYEIVAPDSQEIYYFNRFGQHVSTKDMLTDRFIYNFTYHVDTSYGKLNHVSGAGGHKIYIIRKTTSKISIENTNGLKSIAHISQFDHLLEKFVSPAGAETQFSYEANTGLLTSKVDSNRRAWFYEYDTHGRLKRSILPTGEILVLNYGLVGDRLLVDVKNEKGFDWQLAVSGTEMKVKGEPRERSMLIPGNSAYHVYTPDDVSIQYDGGVHSFSDLSPQSTALLRRKLSLPATAEPPRAPRTSKLEWRYYARRSGRQSYKRVAQVNGVNILTVEYDREKNIDIILNQNNDKVLTIYYNAAGFVTQWSPATTAIGVFNITYDSMGRIINHNWASVSRSYSYDRQGRVVESADPSDTAKKAKKFGYGGENSMPSTVELPSGSRYQLRYDPSGNLVNISSPSRFVHGYLQQVDLNSINYFYYRGNATNPHLLSSRLDGAPKASYYADGQKRVAYFYDSTSRLSKMVYDQAETSLEYHPKTGHLTSVKSIGGEKTRSEMTYGYQGNLLVEILDRRWISDPKSTLPTVVHWFYQYDDRLRLTAAQSVFDETTSQSYKIEYDPLTGRVTSMNGYQFHYSDGKIRMHNDRSGVETTLAPNLAISQTKFTVKGRTISEQRSFYDSTGRMISAAIKTDGDQGGATYEYDVDGRLIAAKWTAGGVDHVWSYAYNADGALQKVNDIQISYDNATGYLKRYGKVEYSSDANGFIIQRGQEYFDYDSFGRLIRAWQPDAHDNRYFYDNSNRLITVERSKKNSWHFYYALVHKPHLITHAYDVASRVQTIFTYDQNDRLIAMETNGAYYFVVTHPNGTPLHVFSDDGSVIKAVIRSPFGVITMDSASDFALFIGQGGRYQDLDSGVVITENGRPIDPNVGRFMSARVEDFFTVDVFAPESTLDAFLVDARTVVNRVPSFDLTITDWLRFNGYDISDIVPLLSPSKEPAFTCGNGLLYVSSECYLEKKIAAFHTLLSVHRSPLLPETPFDRRVPLSFAAVPAPFGDGLVVANQSRMAKVFSTDSIDRSTPDPIITLFNQSIILPLSYLKEGEISRYFWKKDVERATSDWTGLKSEKSRTTSTKVSLDTVTASDGSSRKEIVLASVAARSLIRFGGESAEKETGILVQDLLEKTAEKRWSTERAKAVRNSATYWTDGELAELKEKGRVSGYSPQYRRDPLSHSALLTDPNNIRFVRR